MSSELQTIRNFLLQAGYPVKESPERTLRSTMTIPYEALISFKKIMALRIVEDITDRPVVVQPSDIISEALLGNLEVRKATLEALEYPRSYKIQRMREIMGREPEPIKDYTPENQIELILAIIDSYPLFPTPDALLAKSGRLDRPFYGQWVQIGFRIIPELRLAMDDVAIDRQVKLFKQVQKFPTRGRGFRMSYGATDVLSDALLSHPEVWQIMQVIAPNHDYRLSFHPQGSYIDGDPLMDISTSRSKGDLLEAR